MSNFLMTVGLWLIWGLLAYMVSGLAVCAACFLYAWRRGELKDDITPAQILAGINRKSKP